MSNAFRWALFFSVVLANCGILRGGREIANKGNSSEKRPITVGNGVSSETGITNTQKVPFSKETINEIQKRELKKTVRPSEQRVVPFQEMPPPKELPANEEIKSDKQGGKR